MDTSVKINFKMKLIEILLKKFVPKMSLNSYRETYFLTIFESRVVDGQSVVRFLRVKKRKQFDLFFNYFSYFFLLF